MSNIRYIAYPDSVEEVEIISEHTTFNVKGRASEYCDVRVVGSSEEFPVRRASLYFDLLAATVESARLHLELDKEYTE